MSMPPPPQGGPSPYGYPGPPPQPAPPPGPYYGPQPPNGYGGNYFVPTPGPVFVPTGVQRNKWKRPLIALGLVGLLFGGMMTVAALDDSPSTYVRNAEPGDCLQKTGDSEDVGMVIVDCASSEADYRVVSKPHGDDRCPAVYDTYYRQRGSAVTLRLCLSRVSHGSDSTHDA